MMHRPPLANSPSHTHTLYKHILYSDYSAWIFFFNSIYLCSPPPPTPQCFSLFWSQLCDCVYVRGRERKRVWQEAIAGGGGGAGKSKCKWLWEAGWLPCSPHIKTRYVFCYALYSKGSATMFIKQNQQRNCHLVWVHIFLNNFWNIISVKSTFFCIVACISAFWISSVFLSH